MDNKQNFDCIVMLFFNEMVIFFNFTFSALINFQYTPIEHEEYPILCALPHAGWKNGTPAAHRTCWMHITVDHMWNPKFSLCLCARGLFWRKRAPRLPRTQTHTMGLYISGSRKRKAAGANIFKHYTCSCISGINGLTFPGSDSFCLAGDGNIIK